MENHILEFIANYNSETDLLFIEMDIHGNWPEKWYDVNSNFRLQVSLGIRELKYNVSLELLRDLYRITAQESEKIWACYQYFYEIGQSLIEHGRKKYALFYLEYARCYFDSTLNGGQAKWSDEVVLEIRAFLKEQQKIQTDESILNAIDFGLKYRFGLYRIVDGDLLPDKAERREWNKLKKK